MLTIARNDSRAVVNNQAMQRTPGRAGFTFGVGLSSSSEDRARQTIVQQPEAWSLRMSVTRQLELRMQGEIIRAQIPENSSRRFTTSDGGVGRPAVNLPSPAPPSLIARSAPS